MTKKLKRHEHAYRSLAKTITYRITITIVVFFTTLIVTGKSGDALKVTGITAIISSIVYYVHERVWAHIAWGRTARTSAK